MDEVSDALAGEEEMTPSEMFEALYRVQNNAPMSESERSLSERIFERLNREDGV